MFSHISWYAFFVTMGSACGIYYLVIGILYYKKELLSLWVRKEKDLHGLDGFSATGVDQDESVISAQRQEEQKINFPTLVQELVAELSNYFTEAAKRKLIREEFMTGLQLKINAYWQIRESPYRNAVNHLIQMESQTQCSVYLTEGELELLWKKQVDRAF